MGDTPIVLHRSVTAFDASAGVPSGDVVDAILCGPAQDVMRLYFRNANSSRVDIARVLKSALWHRAAAGAQIVELAAARGQTFELPVRNGAEPLIARPPEYDLFSGRNVLLGISNDEHLSVWCDWLLWHQEHHGADAALILDRGPPDEVAARHVALQARFKEDANLAYKLASMTIVVLSVDQPLGIEGSPHEAHPSHAPDAPARPQQSDPEPDPWHAPLSYRVVLDQLYWRFLKKANGVAGLQVNELAAVDGSGCSVFDVAEQSRSGAISMIGQRAYPWSLRSATEPEFGDHICTSFDVQPNEMRWCITPARLTSEAVLLPTRILGAKSQLTALSFWRFMGLRHCRPSGSNVGRIVPKSSLVENADLLAVSEHFGANPKRQPDVLLSDREDERHPSTSRNRIAIVTTMKNEGPFILEWLAYHRAIGVTDFLIYTNDCTDGTDDFLRLLDKKGFCQWRENPYRNTKMKPQHAALQAAETEDMVKEADWLICMDVDEYVAVHTGDRTIAALLDAVPDANMISLTWRLFGNDGIDTYTDDFVTQSFTSAAHEFANKPHVAWGFKTLFRNNGNFKKLGVHRPKGIQPKAVDRINWVNGSGDPMPRSHWRNAWRSNKITYGYALASLNHYAVRSAESFLVKRDRGRVNHVDRDQGLAYWFRMNHNVVQDQRMHQILPMLQAEYSAMTADPEIQAAHQACVEAHQQKITALKAHPKQKAFFETLTAERMRKLSHLHGHFGTNVYLAGPESIPDDIAARDPSDDFFFTVDHVGEAEH